jgi:hypothetical protein
MRLRMLVPTLFLMSSLLPAQGMESLTLNVIRFAEDREVKFDMLPSRRVGNPQMQGKVRFRDGQYWIEL